MITTRAKALAYMTVLILKYLVTKRGILLRLMGISDCNVHIQKGCMIHGLLIRAYDAALGVNSTLFHEKTL